MQLSTRATTALQLLLILALTVGTARAIHLDADEPQWLQPMFVESVSSASVDASASGFLDDIVSDAKAFSDSVNDLVSEAQGDADHLADQAGLGDLKPVINGGINMAVNALPGVGEIREVSDTVVAASKLTGLGANGLAPPAVSASAPVVASAPASAPAPPRAAHSSKATGRHRFAAKPVKKAQAPLPPPQAHVTDHVQFIRTAIAQARDLIAKARAHIPLAKQQRRAAPHRK